MSSAPHRYLHLDVFTAQPFEGNQLAVFPDARSLDAATMQAIAQEMAFSESTFILPKEDERSDIRMRIFTPGRELPMAGHPTIGSTFALAREGVIPPGSRRFVFGLGVGPVPVDLEWNGADLRFAWMTQLRPVFGDTIEHVEGIAEALGLSESDIVDTGLPVEEVSCGVPFLLVPIATRRGVDSAELNMAALREVYSNAGLDDLPVFLFSTEPGPASRDEATAYSRMFAPGLGVVEDPATGSAAGPLGCYLVHHGVVPASRARAIINRQGVKMGRPSLIHISVGVERDEIVEIKVGGEAVVVGEGVLRAAVQSAHGPD